MADRDLTKTYSRSQFVQKLRRLADAVESGKAFTIQVGGEKLRIPASAAFNVETGRRARCISRALEGRVGGA